MRGARLARLLLRPFLGKADASEAVADLEELAGEKGPFEAHWYFWWAVMGYPARVVVDAVRKPLDLLGSRGWRGIGGGRRNSGREGTMEGMIRDIWYALRSLQRNPAFTAMTIGILALSTGTAVAIFSVVDQVLLEPLPFDEPDALRSVWLRHDDGSRTRMTPGNVRDLETLDNVFEGVAGFQGSTAALGTTGGTIAIRGGAVTPGYFATLGVEPLHGRTFDPEHGVVGAARVVILGQRLWEREFSADPRVVGRVVDLGGASAEVLGVVPESLYPTSVALSGELPFTDTNQDFFVPLTFSEEFWGSRRSHILGAVVRLRDGVTAAQADEALSALTMQLRETDPLNRSESLEASSFEEEVVGDVRFALLSLLGTMGLVLIIAAVNVGALFLLRGDDRTSEISIRRALGSSSAHVVRQFLVEAAIVASAASMGALVVGRVTIAVMQSLVPYQIPRLSAVHLGADSAIPLIAVGAALALLLGVVPAWRALRMQQVRGTRAVTASRAQRRLHGSIVGVQAALGVIVIVGAVLLVRSFNELRVVDLGFSERQTWVFEVRGAGDRMSDVVREVRALPGVASAAIAYDHPLARNWGDGFRIEGQARPEGTPGPSGSLRAVGTDYFTTVGIDVVEGRLPDELDLAAAPLMVINAALRDTHFPDGGAVGSTISVPTAARMFGEDASSFTVAAVVENVRFLGPENDSEPAFYLPLSHFQVSGSNLLVRSEDPGAEVVARVRNVIEAAAPGSAANSARRLEDIVFDMTARPRFNMMLLVTFAGMVLLLCGLGVYGLVGRSVVSRLREIGIRMALGADQTDVASSVMRTALKPIVLGCVAGLGAAWALSGLVQSLLFGVSPTDPLSYLLSALFMTAVAVVATVVPTVRALMVDPAHSLRGD